MKQKYTAQGTYDINGKRKDFSIEYENSVENEENNAQLGELLSDDDPLRFLREGGKFGAKGIKRFFLLLFLFVTANTVLFFYAIARFFSTGLEVSDLRAVAAVLILGVGVTIFAGHRALQFAVIETVRVIYENLSSFFLKICSIAVDKAAGLLSNNKKLDDKQVEKSLNFGKIIHEQLAQMPRFLRKGVVYVLGKVPFAGMLIELSDSITEGDKEQASIKLFNRVDGFIKEDIFGMNNTKWALWLLPLNVLVLLGIIHKFIG